MQVRELSLGTSLDNDGVTMTNTGFLFGLLALSAVVLPHGFVAAAKSNDGHHLDRWVGGYRGGHLCVLTLWV